MSIVHLQNVEILNSNARFEGMNAVASNFVCHDADHSQFGLLDPYIFKITFECIAPLADGKYTDCLIGLVEAVADEQQFCPADLEWKLIYVGSAESEEFDQELDNCMVGPVPVGEY